MIIWSLGHTPHHQELHVSSWEVNSAASWTKTSTNSPVVHHNSLLLMRWYKQSFQQFCCSNAPCWSFGRLQVLLFCLQLLPSHVDKSTTTQVPQHMGLHAANLHGDENHRSDSRIPISLYSSRFNPTATIWNWGQSASQWKPAERKIHVDLCRYIPDRQVAAAAGAQLPGRRWVAFLWRPVVYLKPPPTCSNCWWVGGKRLVNVSLLSFTASFLQQQKKVSEIPDLAWSGKKNQIESKEKNMKNGFRV